MTASSGFHSFRASTMISVMLLCSAGSHDNRSSIHSCVHADPPYKFVHLASFYGSRGVYGSGPAGNKMLDVSLCSVILTEPPV